jgi:CHAD domain-containing protein
MAYRLTHPAVLTDDVPRIVSEELSLVRAAWDDGPDPEERIHKARTAIKRLRALLRLLRPALGDELYRLENHALRDIGRSLSGQRDAHVMVVAARGLATGIAGEPRGAISRSTARSLARRLGAPREESGAIPDHPAKAIRVLERRMKSWPLSDLDFSILAHGLQAAYGLGRKLHRLALSEERSAEHYHEWRKRAKDSRYHIELLHCAWPTPLGALEAELERLTDLLGDGNDLTLLVQRFDTDPELIRGLKHRKSIPGLVSGRRSALWRAAGALGAHVYAERPKSFIDRLRSYWDHWEGCRD